MKKNIVYINGKFTAQRITGVQRLALSLVVAIDKALDTNLFNTRWILVCPPNSIPPVLNNIEIVACGKGTFNLHVWEQIFLPLYTFNSKLMNFSGSAPFFKKNSVCMIPDAAVFDCLSAYKFLYSLWYRNLFKKNVNTADFIFTISNFSKKRLAVNLQCSEEKFNVIYCASEHLISIHPDHSILKELGLRSDDKFLLSVASSNPTKNLPNMLEAFNNANIEGLKLVLVGGTNNRVFNNDRPYTSNDNRIIYAGPINDEQLAALYIRAYAFIFPSFYEGFGIPPLESMSFGCPVLASKAGSIPEVCGEAAIYFNPYSTSDITQAINQIYEDSLLRDQLSKAGMLQSLKFSWESSALELLEHLQSLGLISKR